MKRTFDSINVVIAELEARDAGLETDIGDLERSLRDKMTRVVALASTWLDMAAVDDEVDAAVTHVRERIAAAPTRAPLLAPAPTRPADATRENEMSPAEPPAVASPGTSATPQSHATPQSTPSRGRARGRVRGRFRERVRDALAAARSTPSLEPPMRASVAAFARAMSQHE